MRISDWSSDVCSSDLLQNCLREALVHGEALALPVSGGAEAAELLQDGAAGLRAPGPDPLDEVRAPDLAGVAGGQRQAAVELDALLRQLALDHHLSGDAGVVGARLPQHVAALHALVAAEDVLDRVVQRMAH